MWRWIVIIAVLLIAGTTSVFLANSTDEEYSCKKGGHTRQEAQRIVGKLIHDGLKPSHKTHYSTSEKAPLYILLEDTHHGKAGPSLLRDLEKIRKRLGNGVTVGLEGWYGDDYESNRSILANTDLQGFLLKDHVDNYNLVPLEERDLGLKTTERIIAEDYYRYFVMGERDGKKGILHRNNFYGIIYQTFGLTGTEAFAKGRHLYLKYQQEVRTWKRPFSLREDKSVWERDWLAVNKIIKMGCETFVIVFGAGHTQNIMSHFKQLLKGRYNLFIVKGVFQKT